MKISGEKIKQIRTEKGLSRAALSRISGISIRTLEDWEAGKRNPRNFDLIDAVANALKCSPSDFYDDEYLSALNQQALDNSLKYDDLEEAELIEAVERIYSESGLEGILKLLDRFIYQVGVRKALEIVKEYENESNTFCGVYADCSV